MGKVKKDGWVCERREREKGGIWGKRKEMRFLSSRSAQGAGRTKSDSKRAWEELGTNHAGDASPAPTWQEIRRESQRNRIRNTKETRSQSAEKPAAVSDSASPWPPAAAAEGETEEVLCVVVVALVAPRDEKRPLSLSLTNQDSRN